MTAHEHDNNPHDSRAGRRRRNTIKVPFSARTVEMLNSPAWRVLSLAAHRVIDRLSIELRYHGGHQKAGVPVTYEQFIEYGIGNRRVVAAGIREAVALGFLEIVRQGRAGNADYRQPTLYRLTFEHHTDCEPENFRWRKIREPEQAQARKAQARADIKPAVRRTQKPVAESATKVGTFSATKVGTVSATENRRILGTESATTSHILPRGGRSGGAGGGSTPRSADRRAHASQAGTGRADATQAKTGRAAKPGLVVADVNQTGTGLGQGVIRRRFRPVS
jgi:hypothetical protein